ATTVGFLTIFLTIGVWNSKQGQAIKWVRWLGAGALIAVILQGLLGGLTVKMLLPASVSIGHAVLGQTFFCITIAIVYATSSHYQVPFFEKGSLGTSYSKKLAWAAYVQLFLGAAIRHTGTHVWAHIMGAFFVFYFAFRLFATASAEKKSVSSSGREFFFLSLLILAQVLLGIAAYVLRLESLVLDTPPAFYPAIRTFHQTSGGLILAVSFWLALRENMRYRPGGSIDPVATI
ncbi:MAG: hypothetical protein JKX97_07760, partial [Candidatus Lindowbacteria bacterium]|nr:hypothetical protein [Candidatus Lindowbacteria bacterium]